MKFLELTMINFMRYKGNNTIRFSCNPDKNVTVVTGDNVGGKTTIAQAFRYALYGKVQITKEQKYSDITLLNLDIITSMNDSTRAKSGVILKILDDNVHNNAGAQINNRIYTITRIGTYTKSGQATVKQFNENLTLTYYDASSTEDCAIEIEPNDAQKIINTLFPRNFSPYFLFDGEKWNDIQANGLNNNIKESLQNLTGLTATASAMRHLKEMGSNSALNRIKKMIKGDGVFFENIEFEIEKCYSTISKNEEQQLTTDRQIEYYSNLIEETELELEQNSATEKNQLKYKSLHSTIQLEEQNITAYYKNIINLFSQYIIYELAKPMIKESLSMLQQTNLKKKDIPHIRQATIDYLIERGYCICGCQLTNTSPEYQILMEQRNYLPPADIGSLLGDFERTANVWNNKSINFLEDLYADGEQLNRVITSYYKHQDEFQNLGKTLDSDYNFGEARKNLKYYNEQLKHYLMLKGEHKNAISQAHNRIAQLELEKAKFEKQSKDNAIWHACADLTNDIYLSFKKDYELKEKQVFTQLNTNIQHNFQKMFNVKEKKIQLDKNYNIQLLYATKSGYKEEKNLSEGEKIARNFAFIVSILEYNKSVSKEENGAVETLPLVLDGPFSKLSAENIKNIAHILPQIAEQVIVFTLEKDWQHAQLDNYTGSVYRINRNEKDISASIEEVIYES